MFNIRFILILLNIDKIGKRTVNKLIKNELPNNLDSISILNFLQDNKKYLKETCYLQIEDIIKAKRNCEDIILKCKENNIKIVSILDKDFPQNLKKINNNPVLIYYKGNLDCIKKNKAIAIVGSRKSSDKSNKKAYDLSKILSEDFTIISGLALGCDTYAHKGALKSKCKTVAVMPCSLNKIYPPSNEKLFYGIIDNNGCVISEYAPDEQIHKYNFVQRDRLQIALSKGVVVVETKENGGTMHTVNFAIEQNKVVACLKDDKENINLHLLKQKYIFIIEDEKSLKDFILKINETNIKSIQQSFF